MGSYNYTYMGPYLEVPHAKQDVVENPMYTCTANKKHGGRWGMKFCSECGAPVDHEFRTTTKVAPINVYDICEELVLDEPVWQPASLADSADRNNFGVWKSNLTTIGREIEHEVVCLSDLDMDQFEDDLNAFKELVQPIITAIYEKFGVGAVVKYGIISYYN